MSSAAGAHASWHWVADRDHGAGALEQRFPTQGEAESWLGEMYPDLVAQGVRAVTLREADRTVYGPMSLEVD